MTLDFIYWTLVVMFVIACIGWVGLVKTLIDALRRPR